MDVPFVQLFKQAKLPPGTWSSSLRSSLFMYLRTVAFERFPKLGILTLSFIGFLNQKINKMASVWRVMLIINNKQKLFKNFCTIGVSLFFSSSSSSSSSSSFSLSSDSSVVLNCNWVYTKFGCPQEIYI